MNRLDLPQPSTLPERAKSAPAKSRPKMKSRMIGMGCKRLTSPLRSHKPPNGCSTTA